MKHLPSSAVGKADSHASGVDKGDKGDNFFLLPIPNYPFPITHSQLPITHYPLPIPGT
ncbi:hypothetical protein [Tolypothrix sp. NIES-4075]|uniref:hypothetical protein n=1 Tax=Tolypothrix sp. NIES-4075 TaxID=2005459 RepID=UPI00135C74F6|nr:hypothetical protein [Tolypothrix sp. NIES-4075]